MSTHADDSWEVAGFDIERSTAEAWNAFSVRLADVVSAMDDDAMLRIGALATENEGQPPFVAFRGLRAGRVLARAAANEQLGPYFQLTAEQIAAMEALGWHPPEPASDSDHDAFWHEAAQEDSALLAGLAVAALRDVYGVPHPAFLAPDQLADVLTPPPPLESPTVGAGGAPALTATLPASRTHLDQLVEQQLAAFLGHRPLRDAEGDFGIRVGSTMVFVRSGADAREVLVFAPLVHDIEGRSRAMEVLSDLNTEFRFIKFLLIRDRVFVSLSVFASPFVPAHLDQALRLVSITADEIDDELAAKLRGRTTFAD